MIRVKPGHRKEYICLHKNPRQEVRNVMKKNGIEKHAIFIKDEVLVSVFEYTGDNFKADMKAVGDHPATRAWWEIISPMQEPLENRRPGEWWTMFEPITAYGWEISETEGINE
jgi:L-rhamnose mutarotase